MERLGILRHDMSKTIQRTMFQIGPHRSLSSILQKVHLSKEVAKFTNVRLSSSRVRRSRHIHSPSAARVNILVLVFLTLELRVGCSYFAMRAIGFVE